MLFVVDIAFLGFNGYWWILDVVAGFAGALAGSYPFNREIHPQLNFRMWRYNLVAGWSVRLGWLVPLGLACAFMPSEFGWQTVAITVVYLVIHFAIQWGLLLRYLRLVKYIKPAGPRLRQIVDATAARMNVPVRATWQVEGLIAQAYAFTTIRELAFTDRLLAICNDEEVAAVCSHELAHLAESKSVLAGRLLGSLTLFPLIYMKPAINTLSGLGYMFPVIAMFLIARFARRLSQKMEKRADQMALGEQVNEGVYARALEKIYRENQIPAVNPSKRMSHPHLYDRMVAAGLIPDYPRPATPKSYTAFSFIFLIALAIIAGIAMAFR